MLELVLIVCLAAEPERCERIYLAPEGLANMMQCLFEGPKQATRWAADHPGWFVRRWTCGQPRA